MGASYAPLDGCLLRDWEIRMLAAQVSLALQSTIWDISQLNIYKYGMWLCGGQIPIILACSIKILSLQFTLITQRNICKDKILFEPFLQCPRALFQSSGY